MLKEIKIESKWQQDGDDQIIIENADIIALYRFVYILNNELIEIESLFFYDEKFLAKALIEEAQKIHAIQSYEKLEISILYYYAAESFVQKNSVPHTGQLVETAYYLASRNYISPIQSIRSIDIELNNLTTLASTQNEIRKLNTEIHKKTPFQILFETLNNENSKNWTHLPNPNPTPTTGYTQRTPIST